MNPRGKKYFILLVTSFIALILISTGCNNPPEYKYQSAGNVAADFEADAKVVASTHPKVEPSAPLVVEPAIPELSVAQLLQSGKTYDNIKIKVTGRKGKAMPFYNMVFMISSSDDSYIEVSYARLSGPEKGDLTRLNTLKKMTISGVWDASKKVLVADSVIPPSN